MKRRLYPLVLAFLLAPALAQEGKALYGQFCAGCHGAEAQGLPGAIPPLAGNPRAWDEAHVVQVVRQGISGPLEVGGVTYNGVMPPMPQVSEAQARAIAQYLKGLGGVPAGTAPPAPQIQLAPKGVGFGLSPSPAQGKPEAPKRPPGPLGVHHPPSAPQLPVYPAVPVPGVLPHPRLQ
ncbi:hypothetical protein TJA_04280 [Thermus sp. LT1-2-5]